MRMLIVAAALVLSASLAAAGENCRTSLPSSMPASAELKALDLTDGQRDEILALHKLYRAGTQPLMAAQREALNQYNAARSRNDKAAADTYRATVESYRAEMQQRRDTFVRQVANTLTPEQRTRFEAMRQRQHQ